MSAPTPKPLPRALAACLAAAACLGCYDPAVLVKAARDRAIRTRLEEVDLGTIHVTLPRDKEATHFVEVDLHVFGQAPRYKIPGARRTLGSSGYLLHDRVTTTLRTLGEPALADPNLTALRAELLDAVNDALGEPIVTSVGFYDVRFMRR